MHTLSVSDRREHRLLGVAALTGSPMELQDMGGASR